MLLELKRRWFTDESTVGELYIGRIFQCFTLEDMVREVEGVPVSQWKVPGRTAIPYGSYDLIINYSNRFKRLMPLLLSVPGFTGVRMHWGNRAVDTEGCPLVGQIYDPKHQDLILNSRAAFDVFFPKLQQLLEDEACRITISKGVDPNA